MSDAVKKAAKFLEKTKKGDETFMSRSASPVNPDNFKVEQDEGDAVEIEYESAKHDFEFFPIVHNSKLKAKDSGVAVILKIENLAKLLDVVLPVSNSLAEPIFEGEIVIYSRSSDHWNDPESFECLASYPQNRVFNLVLYQYVYNSRDEGKRQIFEFRKPDYGRNSESYSLNCRVFSFAIGLYFMRGSLPSIRDKSENKLPKLLRDHIKVNNHPMLVEHDFALLLASFDLNKMDLSGILDFNVSKLPDKIKNRMRKGIVGSRLLKIAKECYQYRYESPQEDQPRLAAVMSKVLYEKAQHSMCYLSFHPARQTVQAAHKGFYAKGMYALFLNTKQEFREICRDNLLQIETFKGDKFLLALRFSTQTEQPITHKRVYFTNEVSVNTDLSDIPIGEDLERLIGDPLIF